MKRAQISLVTFDLLAAKAQDEAIGAVIAYEKEILRVRVKKAAQAARLHRVNTLIKRNVDGAIRRLALKNHLIKRMEADPVYAAKILISNRCLFSLAGYYWLSTGMGDYWDNVDPRLYDSKGHIVQL